MDMNINSYIKELIGNYSFHKRIHNYIYVLTKRNMNITIDTKGNSYTDGNNVKISIPQSILKKIEEPFKKEIIPSIFLALSAHEAEHVVSSSFPILKKIIEITKKDYAQVGFSPSFGEKIGHDIANRVEDGRIERRAVNRLPGLAKHLVLLNYLIFKDTKIQKDKLSDLFNCILSIAKIDKKTEGWEFYKKDVPYYDMVECIYPLIREGVNTDSQETFFEACLNIHRIIFPFISSLEKDDENEESKLMEKLNELSKEDSEHTNLDDNFDNDEVGQMIQIQLDSDENSSGKELNENDLPEQIKEVLKSIAKECKRNNIDDKKSNAKENKGQKEMQKEIESNKITQDERNEISTCHKGIEKDFTDRGNYVLSGEKKATAVALKKSLLSIINQNKGECEDFLKRGKIDSSAYSRFISRNDISIFKKETFSEPLDVVFYLWVDMSGSMGSIVGGRPQYLFALEAAAILEDALKDVVPIKIVTYSSSSHRTELITLKEFDKKNKFSLFGTSLHPNSGNCDAYMLSYATKELLKRKEKNKIMICISDGLPSVELTNNPVKDANLAVKDALHHKINIIPIAVGEHSPSDEKRFDEIYEQTILKCEIQTLSKSLLRIIKRIFANI